MKRNSTSSNTACAQRWQSSMMDNYGLPQLTMVSGSGCELTDADGVRYLDLVGGIAVNALGHAHPAITEAVTRQVSRLGHVSNLYAHEPGLRLAEELLDLAGVGGNGRVLFGNSGAEANEAAFKIARLTGRTKIIAAHGGFHGRTMGALALTGQPSKQAPFEPLPRGVVHVPYGDPRALRAEADTDTAAIVLEPIQGENGVVVAPDGYLQTARDIASATGALLVFDEVQTGIGRTGTWFGFQHSGVTPDVITLAKGLGGGLPLGACIGIGTAGDLLRPGQHGSTFGGNPISCAAALAVLQTIENDGLLDHADALGKSITAAINRLAHPQISEVRGAGLLIGIGLTQAVARQVAAEAQRAGFLINAVQPTVLRLAPPLILHHLQAQQFLDHLPDFLPAQ